MVYFFGMQPLLATSYSLFIVGSSSLVGAFSNMKRGLVNTRAVFLFGTSSIITVFLTRKFIIPVIPENIFSIGEYEVSASVVTMVLLAVLMLAASISMIRNQSAESERAESSNSVRFAKLTLYGIGLGLVTGFLGAGGGFLLIPVLVLVLKLPMKKAIGTSLLIIALNALIGFIGDLGHFNMDWLFLLKISAIAMAGILLGGLIGKKLPAEKLKTGFGWFVLVVGIYIILKETLS